MPEVAFMKIDGIAGESNAKGHKDEVDVLAFEHSVSKEVDPLDCSRVKSDRRHAQASVTKQYDKASPLLYQKLCQGATINQIDIKWFRMPAKGGGDPEHYFTHTFKDCVITAIRPVMVHALNPTTKHHGHEEIIEFGYKQITWEHVVGGTSFTDDLRE